MVGCIRPAAHAIDGRQPLIAHDHLGESSPLPELFCQLRGCRYERSSALPLPNGFIWSFSQPVLELVLPYSARSIEASHLSFQYTVAS